jgi:DNA-binding CsgD family transcriptional regulator
MVDFKVGLLIHPKSLLIVVIGSVFLTLAKYQKGMDLKEMIEIGKWHSLITGVILSFLLNVTTLSTPIENANQLLSVALNFRPLFYSMIIYLVLLGRTTKNKASSLPQQLLITEETKHRLKLCYQLTQREYEIALLLLDGQTNLSISDKLIISEGTTKKHVSNIYKKCQVNNRDQLYLLTCQLITTVSHVDGKV